MRSHFFHHILAGPSSKRDKPITDLLGLSVVGVVVIGDFLIDVGEGSSGDRVHFPSHIIPDNFLTFFARDWGSVGASVGVEVLVESASKHVIQIPDQIFSLSPDSVCEEISCCILVNSKQKSHAASDYSIQIGIIVHG